MNKSTEIDMNMTPIEKLLIIFEIFTKIGKLGSRDEKELSKKLCSIIFDSISAVFQEVGVAFDDANTQILQDKIKGVVDTQLENDIASLFTFISNTLTESVPNDWDGEQIISPTQLGNKLLEKVDEQMNEKLTIGEYKIFVALKNVKNEILETTKNSLQEIKKISESLVTLQGIVLASNVSHNSSEGFYGDFFLHKLFQECSSNDFLDGRNEQIAWQEISAYFVANSINAKQLLVATINSNTIKNYSKDVPLVLEFFLAKLLLKQGDRTAANTHFSHIKELIKITGGLDLSIRNRLSLIIESRELAENINVNNTYGLALVRKSLDKFAEIEAEDKYRAYEIVSILGKSITNIAKNPHLLRPSVLSDIQSIITENDYYIELYDLTRHRITNTALKWFTTLHTQILQKGNDGETLRQLAVQGFLYSKQQKNTIFYIQSGLVGAVAYSYNKKTISAYTLAALCGYLMRKNKLGEAHEGINTSLSLILLSNPKLYSICIQYKNSPENYRQLTGLNFKLSDLNQINEAVVQTIRTMEMIPAYSFDVLQKIDEIGC